MTAKDEATVIYITLDKDVNVNNEAKYKALTINTKDMIKMIITSKVISR